SGGAALVGGPLADAEGRLYFASQDGTLHAYEADGRYRFAFTLVGTPLGAPSLRSDDGTLLLGTSERFVYAISQAGALRWRATNRAPIWSSIVPRGQSEVVFVGLDEHVYAMGTGGRAHFRVPLPARAAGEPFVDAALRIWVPLADGVARLEGSKPPRHLARGLAPQRALAWGDEIGLLVDDGLVVIDQDGRERERLTGLAFASAGAEHIIVDSAASLRWRGARGDERRELALPEQPSGAAWTDGRWLALPLGRGWLAWAGAEGSFRLMRLGEAALGQPIAAGQHLYVPDADGRICAVDIPGRGAGPSAGAR
ncbi:MAG TPA: PQQ-binding-like beta-propeller repeat protein, partial [Polyangiaceae bacterium]|nr:PQQ-binding-like beta-propeller repeat protein [Polyangiaceae bacterium]